MHTSTITVENEISTTYIAGIDHVDYRSGASPWASPLGHKPQANHKSSKVWLTTVVIISHISQLSRLFTYMRMYAEGAPATATDLVRVTG